VRVRAYGAIFVKGNTKLRRSFGPEFVNELLTRDTNLERPLRSKRGG